MNGEIQQVVKEVLVHLFLFVLAMCGLASMLAVMILPVSLCLPSCAPLPENMMVVDLRNYSHPYYKVLRVEVGAGIPGYEYPVVVRVLGPFDTYELLDCDEDCENPQFPPREYVLKGPATEPCLWSLEPEWGVSQVPPGFYIEWMKKEQP